MRVVKEEPLEILAKISPTDTATCCKQFVYATLRLSSGLSYPEEPAQMDLLDIRGALSCIAREGVLFSCNIHLHVFWQ